MRNNLLSTKRVCQTDDNENIKCENITVALFVLNFVWCVCRVFQTESSLTLPCVLAVHCETELLLEEDMHFKKLKCDAQFDGPTGALQPRLQDNV